MLKAPFDPKLYPWPSDWRAIPQGFEEECASVFGYLETDGRYEAPATNFVDELHREISVGHLLYGRNFIAIACSNRDPDDVLFYTDDRERPFAFVHLTWHAEPTPDFPFTKIYSTMSALMAECSAGV